jgi:hypothetical protein
MIEEGDYKRTVKIKGLSDKNEVCQLHGISNCRFCNPITIKLDNKTEESQCLT